MNAYLGLAERWRRARQASLRDVVASDGVVDRDEGELLNGAASEAREVAARSAFDNSLRLGASFARFHATSLDLPQLPDALARVADAAPCLQGTWTVVADEPALRLERPGCPARVHGAAACDWWREAISGLVLGLTGGVRHARHASCGQGADRCVDVFYQDPESRLRFGPIPDDLAEALAAVTRTVAIFDSSIAVKFLGVSEGVLYYQLLTTGCGDTPLRARPLIERSVQRRHPRLALREISPRSVLEDS